MPAVTKSYFHVIPREQAHLGPASRTDHEPRRTYGYRVPRTGLDYAKQPAEPRRDTWGITSVVVGGASLLAALLLVAGIVPLAAGAVATIAGVTAGALGIVGLIRARRHRGSGVLSVLGIVTGGAAVLSAVVMTALAILADVLL